MRPIYPSTELLELAERKRRLIVRISERRMAAAEAGARIAEVVKRAEGWAEKIRQWRKLAATILPLFGMAGSRRIPGKAHRPRWRKWLNWGLLGWKLARAARPFTYADRAE